MALIDRSFVDGLFWRMLALGAVFAAAAAIAFSWRFGYSLALGALMGAVSLRLTVFVISRMLRGVIEENPRAAGWALILAVKLFLLAIAIWICLATLNVHALAFVIGYKMIFPALIWQAKSQPEHFEPDHETDEKESS